MRPFPSPNLDCVVPGTFPVANCWLAFDVSPYVNLSSSSSDIARVSRKQQRTNDNGSSVALTVLAPDLSGTSLRWLHLKAESRNGKQHTYGDGSGLLKKASAAKLTHQLTKLLKSTTTNILFQLHAKEKLNFGIRLIT